MKREQNSRFRAHNGLMKGIQFTVEAVQHNYWFCFPRPCGKGAKRAPAVSWGICQIWSRYWGAKRWQVGPSRTAGAWAVSPGMKLAQQFIAGSGNKERSPSRKGLSDFGYENTVGF